MKPTPVLENIDRMAQSLYAFTKGAESLGEQKVELVWETLSPETRAYYQEEACRQMLESLCDNLPSRIYTYLNGQLGSLQTWENLTDSTKALYIDMVKDLGLVSTIALED